MCGLFVRYQMRKGEVLTSAWFIHPRPQVLILPVLFLTLIQAISVKAYADVSVTGEPNAVKIEAREASVEELFAALSKTYDVRYRMPMGLKRPISGSYEGSLLQVLVRVLQGFNFSIESSTNGVSVAVYGLSGSPDNHFDLATDISGPNNTSPTQRMLSAKYRSGLGEQKRAHGITAITARMHRVPNPE